MAFFAPTPNLLEINESNSRPRSKSDLVRYFPDEESFLFVTPQGEVSEVPSGSNTQTSMQPSAPVPIRVRHSSAESYFSVGPDSGYMSTPNPLLGTSRQLNDSPTNHDQSSETTSSPTTYTFVPGRSESLVHAGSHVKVQTFSPERLVLSPEVPIAAGDSSERWNRFVKQNRKPQSPVLKRLNDTQLITLGSFVAAGIENISQNFFPPNKAETKSPEKMALESNQLDQSNSSWSDDNDQNDEAPEDRAFISPTSSGDECDVKLQLSSGNFHHDNEMDQQSRLSKSQRQFLRSMSDAARRRETFQSWPRTGPKINIRSLVRDGWFYSKEGNRLQCCKCGGEINLDIDNSDIMESHRIMFPYCRSNNPGNEPQAGRAFSLAAESDMCGGDMPMPAAETSLASTENNQRFDEADSNLAEQDWKCRWCRTAIADIVVIPCNHLSLCLACSRDATSCPRCKRKIMHKLQINL